MKKNLVIIVSTVLAFTSINLSAQEYRFTSEIGYSALYPYSEYTDDIFNSFNINLLCGYKCYDGQYYALGTGVNLFSDVVRLPLLFNYKCFFDRGAYNYPFASVTVGYEYDITNSYSGGFAEIGGGVDVNLYDRLSIYFMIGVDMLYQYSTFFSGISFKLGFTF